MKTLILLTALLATPALASTEAAWVAHDKAARAACIAASGLLRATASSPIMFSDRTGYDVLLVRGIYRQRFMKGAAGTMLCLYERRTRRAEVSEAKRWSVR